ncbi:MAG: hypothetical protein J6W69_01290 [Bacteroidales bacterium]|nr:hypothetical protein [Bacteroidales bacterium]
MKIKRFSLYCALFLWPMLLFAQIGTRFPSERKVIRDPQTGVELVFLTSRSGTGDSKGWKTMFSADDNHPDCHKGRINDFSATRQ